MVKLKGNALIIMIILGALITTATIGVFLLSKKRSTIVTNTKAQSTTDIESSQNYSTIQCTSHAGPGYISSGPAEITQESQGYKKFKGDRFSFLFPESWEPDGASAMGTSFYLSQNDQFTILIIDTYTDTKDIPSFTNGQEMKLDNVKATFSSGEIKTGSVIQVVAQKDGFYFYIGMSSTDKSVIEKYRNDFDGLVNSFKFDGPCTWKNE